ncbi:MAG: DUF1592 domain-containing protein, partial [Myxococcota bacterium]
VTEDEERLARIVPSSSDDDDTRARRFIEAFGLRAHRRPLDSAEVDSYMAVFTAGKTLFPPMSAFESGIRLTLEAFLQSPNFVYRIERSDIADDRGIPLDDYEIASRISYFLWNSMPDETLLTAANEGRLHSVEDVRAQAARMLADPKAQDVVARFHDALLMVDKYQSVAPSSAFFSDIPDDLPALIDRENDLFIRMMFEEDGSWKDILTSSETFVNEDLARIYGLQENFGPQFERVTLDAEQRRGLFTQLGFLMANATSVNPDPIHRGVFLTERIACNPVAAPPEDIPPLPAVEGRTNRETVEAHTEVPGSSCSGCHSLLINPFGWPFEGYDAMGAVRTEDNGLPIDSTASIFIKGEMYNVANAVELADTLSASKSVHECYAKHWIEYAMGRPLIDEDKGLIEAIQRLSTENGSVKSLLARIVESPAFLARSTQELP